MDRAYIAGVGMDLPEYVEISISTGEGRVDFSATNHLGIVAVEGDVEKVGKDWEFTWRGKNGERYDKRAYRTVFAVVRHCLDIITSDGGL